MCWVALMFCFAMPSATAHGSVDLLAPPSAPDPLATDFATDPPGFQEVPSLRTQRTSTFVNERGVYITRSYAGSVNYRDPRSKLWRPIDNRLLPSIDSTYAFKNAANRYEAEFPRDLSDPVRVGVDGASVRITLQDADGPAYADEGKARYADAMPGVSVEYTPVNDGVKESIVLESAGASRAFRFAIDVSAGVDVRESKAGGLDFVRDGEVELSLAPPTMKDSSKGHNGFSADVTQSLEKTAGGYVLTLEPDQRWLESKNRVWPVVLDPSLFLRSQNECTIFAPGDYWETTRYCRDPNYAQVGAGVNNLANPPRLRSLFKFDLSQIPDDAEIADAKFALSLLSTPLTGDHQLDLHALTRSWTDSVNWRTHNGTNAWTAAGGDFEAASGGSTSILAGSTGYVTWDVDPLVQRWVNRSLANHGMMLKAYDEFGVFPTLHYFQGSSSPFSGYWPYLDVKWKPQGRYASESSTAWVVDGGTTGTPRVNALEATDETVYVGGDFSVVGRRTGMFATFASSGSAYQPNLAEVAGTAGTVAPGAGVRAIAPDGSGGWFVGGSFRYVGGKPRDRLAHIRDDGSLDENWNPGASGTVRALAVSGGHLFVGGDFNKVGGVTRKGVAKLDASTGATVTGWDAGLDGSVHAIAVADAGTMYIGGSFTSIAGGTQPRQNLAALDPGTGNPLSPVANASAPVRALALSGTKLYAGGGFTTFGGTTHNRLARVETGTGAPSVDHGWNPSVTGGAVYALQAAGTRLYVGGEFTQVGGPTRNGIAAVATGSTASLESWDPASSAAGAKVYALQLNGDALYAGGDFASMGGQPRRHLAELSTTIDSGAASTWDPSMGNTVQALALCTGSQCHGGVTRVAAGGQFRTANALGRRNLAELNPATGEPTTWNPSPDGEIKALELARGALYVGGDYQTVAHAQDGLPATRKGLAYFIAKTGELAPWDPTDADWGDPNTTPGNIEAIHASDSALYVAARRLKYRGVARERIGAFDLDTGELNSWNPQPDGPVKDIDTEKDLVFFAGDFQTVMGNDNQPHNRPAIASYHERGSPTHPGSLTGWQAQLRNGAASPIVTDIALANAKIYVVGDFTHVGPVESPVPREGAAAFPSANGGGALDLAWVPDIEGTTAGSIGHVDAIDADAFGVYIGGRFFRSTGQPRSGLAGLDPNTGATLPISPELEVRTGTTADTGTVRALEITDGRLHAGGDWYAIGAQAQAGLASFAGNGWVSEPREGHRVRRRVTLRAATHQTLFTGARFEFRKWKEPGQTPDPWTEIPIDKVRGDQNQSFSGWPLGLSEGKSPRVVWDVPGTPGVAHTNAKYEVRAALSESNGEQFKTEPVMVTLDQDAPAPSDAVEAVGPGSLDLLTGNFSITRDDVKESGFNSGLTFSRTYNSRQPQAGNGSVSPLGPHWKTSLPVDEAASDFVRIEVDRYDFEEEQLEFATVITSDGGGFYFLFEHGQWKPEAGSEDLTLTRQQTGEWKVKDLDNNETYFGNEATTGCEPARETCVAYMATEIRQPGDGKGTYLDYEPGLNNKLRIRRMFAAGSIPAGQTSSYCVEANPPPTTCRWLQFGYAATTTASGNGEHQLGDYAGRLTEVGLFTVSPGSANPKYDRIYTYSYDSDGRLRAATDARTYREDPSPSVLLEKYDYDYEHHLKWLKSPGQNPWTISYAAIPSDPNTGRLRSVSREQPGFASPAQTTVLYDVPTSGSNAPYEMAPAELARWGQSTVPTDVTAIFAPTRVPSAPADQPPALPASEYRWASVHYMDRNGREINVSAPGGGSNGHITTTEYDEHNNVGRQLTAENRLKALQAGANSATRAAELETRREFSPDGIELLHEWGPLHTIQLADGSPPVEARAHTAYTYDGFSELEYGTPPAHLVDTVTVGARIPGEEADRDARRTSYDYFDDGAAQGMKLRKPTTTVVDPGSSPKLNLRTRVRYNADGLELSRSTPGAAEEADPRTAQTIYYTSGANPDDSDCGGREEWKNLPCKVVPGSQPNTSGPPDPPKLPETKLEYDRFYQVTTKVESVRQNDTTTTRTTITQYDLAGRVERQTVSRDPELPAERLSEVVTTYDPNTGQTATTTLAGGGPTIAREYDALGRIHKYHDGDMSPDSLTTTTYDAIGRVSSVAGPKGNQSFEYYDVAGNESGWLRRLTDSAAGSFEATTYNADGQLLEQQYPNGLRATTTYDSIGTATNLTYQKGSSVWLQFEVTESIHGQWMRHRSTLSDQDFQYDRAGRLIDVKDAVHPGTGCTKRQYSYDAESNRTQLETRTGTDSNCTGAESSTATLGYDSANRLAGAGVEYDDFGRITRLPAAYADAGASPQLLETSYYVDDLVREQTQGTLRNSYALDPMRRQRTREESERPSLSQPFALVAAETYHYSDDSDSPSWIERSPESGSASWSRMIEGIGGDLVAIQSSDGPTQIQLTNLHGDVVGTCSVDPGATSFTRTGEADEFGVPRQDTSPRFSWLGERQRRTELKSGVVQMGVRSYVPTVGRFLQVDPVSGGSANAYDYAMQDPLNTSDLDGRRAFRLCTHGFGGRTLRVGRGRRRREHVFYGLNVNCNHPGIAVASRLTLHKAVRHGTRPIRRPTPWRTTGNRHLNPRHASVSRPAHSYFIKAEVRIFVPPQIRIPNNPIFLGPDCRKAGLANEVRCNWTSDPFT